MITLHAQPWLGFPNRTVRVLVFCKIIFINVHFLHLLAQVLIENDV